MEIPEILPGHIQALFGIAEAMSMTFSRQAVLDAMLESLVQSLGYKAASVRLFDAEHKTLVLQASTGLSQVYLAKGTVEIAKSPVDQQVSEGYTIELYDVQHDPGFQYPEAAQREGISSILAVPLTLQHRVNGALRVYTSEPRHFDATERAFLNAVGKLIARAIATAHLFQAFQTIAREANSSLKLEEVLTRLLRTTISELNFKAGLIRLLDTERQVMRLVAAEGLSKDYLGKGVVRIGESAIDQQVLQGQPVTIYDVTTDPRFHYQEAAAREGIRSVQAVPLSAGNTIIGVLRVYSSQSYRFSEEEISFLSAVADLGVIAIEHAKMHEVLHEKYETLRTDASGWYRFLTLS